MTFLNKPVFVFCRDGEAMPFRSGAEAMGYLEAVDVDDGEYEAAFTFDGYIVSICTSANDVILDRTDDRDEAGLHQRLELVRIRDGLSSPASDITALADEMLHRSWQRRWPRRPRWLAARLHGTEPPKI